MLHRAADRPARPEVPRRATGLFLQRRLVRLLRSGWNRDCRRLWVAKPPCLSGWYRWRLRPGFALRLPGRSTQASPLQSARGRLSGLVAGRGRRSTLSDAGARDTHRRRSPRCSSLVPTRGPRLDRRSRRGGLASRRKPRRWPWLGARYVIRSIDRTLGLPSAHSGNRKRDPRQSSKSERADSQPGEPETGEGADGDRGLAEAARPVIVIRHEDGSLELRAGRRNPCRCFSLDRRGRHSDVLLSLYTEEMPDPRAGQAQKQQDLQNFYTLCAWFCGGKLESRRPFRA